MVNFKTGVTKWLPLAYVRSSEDVLDVSWTSYVRSIYVLCLWGADLSICPFQKVFLLYFQNAFSVYMQDM